MQYTGQWPQMPPAQGPNPYGAYNQQYMVVQDAGRAYSQAFGYTPVQGPMLTPQQQQVLAEQQQQQQYPPAQYGAMQMQMLGQQVPGPHMSYPGPGTGTGGVPPGPTWESLHPLESDPSYLR
jgi:hypothetical protein